MVACSIIMCTYLEADPLLRVVLAQFLAQGPSVEDEVREAMGNGGIYVVAPADEAQELTQQTAIVRATEALAGGGLLSLSSGEGAILAHLLKDRHNIL